MSQTQATLGWMGPDPILIKVINRTTATVAVGDVVLLDHGKSDAASTDTTQVAGSATSGICNIVNPATAYLAHGIFGVVQKAAVDNAETTILLRGRADAVSVDAATTLDDQMVAANGARALSIGAGATDPNAKILFLPLTITSGAATTDGFFDGVNGYGQVIDQ